jgi:hypothetical protein
MDDKRFIANFTGMAEAFGAEVSPLKINIYTRVLEQFTDYQIERAIMQACTSLKFFPKPVELIEFIQGKASDQAMLAWEQLLQAIQKHGSYQSIIFEDGRIAQTVELMGGWLQVCTMTIDETHWRMSDFTKIYQGLPGNMEPKKLIGRYEQENAARGFAKSILEPIQIGKNQKLLKE